MTIEQAAAALRRKEVSSVELVNECFARIQQLDSRLNTFLTLLPEQALAAARQADQELSQGQDRGPLHGIPYALKDVFATRGIRTTCGSKLFQDHVPSHDSAVAELLQKAGAILVGKTGMHELAYGITSNNPHFGAVRNPHDPERIPGGSSGGSAAAVAADMVPFAMGSDTGGSIRIPAAFCGTVGLKPTSGRVSRYGVLPLDFSLDHMGPLTRTVRDAALVLNAIAGHDHRDDTSSSRPVEDYLPLRNLSLAGLRVGRPANFYEDRLEPAVADAYSQAIQQAQSLGAQIVSVQVPDIAAINVIGRIILLSEAAALLEPYREQRHLFGADVLALLDQGRMIPATDYLNAQRLRRVMQKEFAQVWNQVDVLMTPTTPLVAPPIGVNTVFFNQQPEDVRIASTRLVRAINVLGLPALSLPVKRNHNDLPIGLQIVTESFAEARLLQVAMALE